MADLPLATFNRLSIGLPCVALSGATSSAPAAARGVVCGDDLDKMPKTLQQIALLKPCGKGWGLGQRGGSTAEGRAGGVKRVAAAKE